MWGDPIHVVGGEDVDPPIPEFSPSFPGHPEYQSRGGAPLRGAAPGGATRIQIVAAEIMRRRADGTWPQGREPWQSGGALPRRAGTADEQRQRLSTMVDGLKLEPTDQGPQRNPMREYVLNAPFLPNKVGVSLAMVQDHDQGFYDDYDYEEGEEYEEEEYLEEEEEEEEGRPQPAADEDKYEEQLLEFRKQMRDYRKMHPEHYPAYLQKVLASGLPRKYHKHFEKELKRIEENGGVVPKKEKKEKKSKKADKDSKSGSSRHSDPSGASRSDRSPAQPAAAAAADADELRTEGSSQATSGKEK
eukprot:TRINITY_DN908_c0_g1_i2.p1 TRINITY_DN908_c0_g1~~TRINITY_DN908_c0_g1_i2.p1  ORF type:complete len:302 (+),score=75.15 TRINITY_DN908_c0_g1_i2:113-1018(+)